MESKQNQISYDRMKGMSVVLMGLGTIDIHRSIQSSLIEFGCEVFWTMDKPKKELFEHKIEFLFHLDIFSKGANYIDQLRKNLDRQNPDAVIINIPLSHPLLSINGLGISSVNAINSFLKDRRIVLWSMCLTSLKEYQQYGLCNGFFAPLGINEYFLLAKDRKELRDNWFNKHSEYQKVPYHFVQDPSIEDEKPLINEKIVYAGVPNSDWEKLIPPLSLTNIEFLEENFLPNSKEQFRKESNMEIEPGNMKAFIEYHFLWSVHIPLKRRRRMLQLVSKQFPNHVSIWGDGWEKYINFSYSTSVAPRYFYQQALCCLDFGSTQFETPLYVRTCEIIKMGGLLVSGYGDDSTNLSTGNQFETSDQMLNIIEESFDQNKRQIKMDRQKLLYSKYNLKQSILDLLEQVQKVI